MLLAHFCAGVWTQSLVYARHVLYTQLHPQVIQLSLSFITWTKFNLGSPYTFKNRFYGPSAFQWLLMLLDRPFRTLYPCFGSSPISFLSLYPSSSNHQYLAAYVKGYSLQNHRESAQNWYSNTLDNNHEKSLALKTNCAYHWKEMDWTTFWKKNYLYWYFKIFFVT